MIATIQTIVQLFLEATIIMRQNKLTTRKKWSLARPIIRLKTIYQNFKASQRKR